MSKANKHVQLGSDGGGTLAMALEYAGRGWSVIPIQSRKKEPLIPWKEFTKRIASQEEIKGWFRQWPDAGVSVVTGSVSGIVVVDIDPKPGVEDSMKQISLPPTHTVKTGRGTHHYYRWPHSRTAPNVKGYLPGVDVQGDKAYVCAPPSIHPNGETYVAANAVENMVDAPEWVVGIKQGRKSKTTEGSFEGVGEGRRNDAAASVAGKILRLLPREDWESSGWDQLCEWNATNSPPLPANELEQVLSSITAREDARRLDAGEPTDADGAISLKELCATEYPATKWAVEGLFEACTLNMISAPPNQFKSWIVLHLALCLANGLPMFGHFRTDRQAVMVINEDDPLRSVKDRMLQLGPKTNEPVFFHVEKGFKLTDLFVTKILKEVEDKGIRFVILDTFRSVHLSDENSSTEMQKVMDQLKRFTRAGLTVLVTHHNRKRPASSPVFKDDLGEDARGSTAIVGALHGMLSCQSVIEEGRTIIVMDQKKLKGDKKMPLPFRVRIDETGEEGVTKTLAFVYDGEYKRDEHVIEKVQEAILETLTQGQEWLGVNDFVDLAVGKKKTVRVALAHLVTAGKIKTETRDALGEAKKRTLVGKGNEKLYTIKQD